MVELLVTLAIISILAAIALPSTSLFFSRKTMTQQSDLFSTFFNQIRERAIREGISWRISFRPADKQWLAFGDSNNNLEFDIGELQIGPSILFKGIRFGSHAESGPNKTSIPADGISFVGNSISFSPMGACNSGTIYICSEDRSVALRLSPASGTVLCYEYIDTWRLKQ